MREELANADVICCWCAEAVELASLALPFAQVLIDDAGLLSSLEAAAPFLLSPSHAVILGDRLQLPAPRGWREPDWAAAAGPGCLQGVWGARLGEARPRSVMEATEYRHIDLRTQYKQAAGLRLVSSVLFHSGALHDAPSLRSLPLSLTSSLSSRADPLRSLGTGGAAVTWCHVQGREQRAEEGEVFSMDSPADLLSPSLHNPPEAAKVVEAVTWVMKHGHVAPEEVLVTTPYEAQQRLLEQLLASSALPPSLRPRVLLSHLLPSPPPLLLLFSPVRSSPSSKVVSEPSSRWRDDHLGLVADARLLASTLATPRLSLFVIGNAETLGADLKWRELISIFKDAGCFVSADAWPPAEPL